MAQPVTWDLKHYDIDGNGITAASYDPATFSTSNHIRHATNRTWSLGLNTYDQLDFTLYLDDPMAATIRRGRSVIKMFRAVDDEVYDKHLTTSLPAFCGVVGYTLKDGQANTMKVTAYSPLWRLQTHFHLLNHYLELNIETNAIYTQSELMWKLIDLVNGAFGGDSFTGISKGIFSWGLPDEPQIGPYFVGKGTNTWSNIFEDIMQRPNGPDIVPRYAHTDGNRRQMYFDTDQKRGADRTADLSFNYHTGSNDNCDNMTEEEQIIPGDFGNYLWVVGQGGPNTGRFAARANSSSTTDSDGYGEIGVYMTRVDRDEVKRIGALGPISEAEFAKRKTPVPGYTVVVSPVGGLYYDVDFTLGDVGYLNSGRTGMVLSNIKQRIYNAVISMSENNVETASIEVSKDFYGKVAT